VAVSAVQGSTSLKRLIEVIGETIEISLVPGEPADILTEDSLDQTV
jgi:hypothetical protein